MASNAFAGVGTKFQRWDGDSWEDIAEINSIEGPGMIKDVIEVTSLETAAGYNEFITGFAEGGMVTLNMNFTRATYELMKEDFELDEIKYYSIALPDADSEPSTFSFAGLVVELPMTIDADDKVNADVVIQVTGEVTFDIGSYAPGSEEEVIEIPVYQSSHVDDATPSQIHIIYDLTLDSGHTPATTAYTVQVNSVGRTVNSVSVSGTQVTLTLASEVLYGDTVTVAYTKPGTNPVQTSEGGEAESFTTKTVTNNVAESSDITESSDSSGAQLAYNYALDYKAWVEADGGQIIDFDTVVSEYERLISTYGDDLVEAGLQYAYHFKAGVKIQYYDYEGSATAGSSAAMDSEEGYQPVVYRWYNMAPAATSSADWDLTFSVKAYNTTFGADARMYYDSLRGLRAMPMNLDGGVRCGLETPAYILPRNTDRIIIAGKIIPSGAYSSYSIVAHGWSTDANGVIKIFTETATTYRLLLGTVIPGPTAATAASSNNFYSLDTLVHFKVDVQFNESGSGTYAFYKDGVAHGSGSLSGNAYYPKANYNDTIGSGRSSGREAWNGYIQQVEMVIM